MTTTTTRALSAITLFDYCVYARRLGSSRDLAWVTWRKHGDETRRRDFDRAWKAARAAEEPEEHRR